MFKKILKVLFWSFLIWFLFKTLLFQTFNIPSASMNGTLFEGDFVVINKLSYGARLPITPLAYQISNNTKYLDIIKLPYLRLFGFDKINRNDVVAFNFSLTDDLPIDLREKFIKRCIAIPGDSIKINNSIVYINNNHYQEPVNVYRSYTVMSNQFIDSLTLNSLIKFNKSISINEGKNNLLISEAQAKSLKKIKHISSVKLEIFPKDYYHPSAFPNNPAFPWNYDFFGPLYVPKKGDSIILDKNNLVLYQRIIERFEEAKLEFKKDSVFINHKSGKYYTFKQNYYFLVGDNRYNSIDSRVWGLIPESHIIGKASLILRSSKSKERFLLKIN